MTTALVKYLGLRCIAHNSCSQFCSLSVSRQPSALALCCRHTRLYSPGTYLSKWHHLVLSFPYWVHSRYSLLIGPALNVRDPLYFFSATSPPFFVSSFSSQVASSPIFVLRSASPSSISLFECATNERLRWPFVHLPLPTRVTEFGV